MLAAIISEVAPTGYFSFSSRSRGEASGGINRLHVLMWLANVGLQRIMYFFRLVQNNGASFGIPMRKNDPETTDGMYANPVTPVWRRRAAYCPVIFLHHFGLFLKYYCSGTDLGVHRGGYLLSSSLGRWELENYTQGWFKVNQIRNLWLLFHLCLVFCICLYLYGSSLSFWLLL